MTKRTAGKGTKEDPWALKTPPGTSEFTLYRDDSVDPALLVCQVGATKLTYLARVLDDMVAMLKKHGDWMLLGSSDESKDPPEGSVEAWGRSPKNPVRGWYGQRKGYRGRLAMYVPPLLERLGKVELEHGPKNNRVRAK
ncbi:MAG: hypothetical protein U0169_04705 [Polyangiaceae bacterium]